MLEADEVDEDYFTPISSTTLANIFGSSSQHEVKTDNESLKYTPPKNTSKSLVPKATECIFASALIAYEWLQNEYLYKGKLGFAIIKHVSTNSHEIVLYDSNKKTLAKTTVVPNLRILVKDNQYISYYDNLNKFWSIHGTENEIQKVTSELLKLNCDIGYSIIDNTKDKGPPAPDTPEQKSVVTQEIDQQTMESDTDSFVNKKTKESILNRMANMGQSVLPRRLSSAKKTSDSSDTNEVNDSTKPIRHKPTKRINNYTDYQQSQPSENNKIIPLAGTNFNNSLVHSYGQAQLVPVESVSAPQGSNMRHDGELNLFMTEQRICNSELRINMGRISDKVDQVLDNIKTHANIDKVNTTSNFQTEILQKLLSEYETKIKTYENIIATNNLDVSLRLKDNTTNMELDSCKTTILKLKGIIESQNSEIMKLNDELKVSVKSLNEINEDRERLLQKVADLDKTLISKQDEIQVIARKFENTSVSTVDSRNIDMSSKLKSVMNDTYQVISSHFDNNENYTGDTIKNIVAAAIKKVTLNSLNDSL